MMIFLSILALALGRIKMMIFLSILALALLASIALLGFRETYERRQRRNYREGL